MVGSLKTVDLSQLPYLISLPPAMFDQPAALDHPAALYISTALGFRLPPTFADPCSGMSGTKL